MPPLRAAAALLRRRWRLLAALGLLLAVGTLAAPHLWAWYHWHAGTRALDAYRATEARYHLEACLKVWPGSAEVRLLAARAARRAGAFDDAEQHLREADRLGGGADEAAELEWALLRASRGDLAESVEEYLIAQGKRDPARAVLVCEALAEGYLRASRIFDTFACVERWLGMEPDNVQALFLRGNAWRQARKLQKAVPDYLRVVELDPERDEARLWLAVGLIEAGRYADALPHLERLLERLPGDRSATVHLARTQKGLGQLRKARETLDALLEESPGHGPALLVRGEVEMAAGDLAGAEKWLRAAARAMPHDYAAQWSLHQNLRQQGKDAEAKAQHARVEGLRERLERVGEIRNSKMSARPHDPALHCELGTLYMGLGQQEVGEHWLHSALTKDPAYGPAHAALAEYYDRTGDAAKAARHRAQAAPKRP